MKSFSRLLLALLLMSSSLAVCAQKSHKREFRGAWIQCVNGQFLGMGTQKMQQTLSSTSCNATASTPSSSRCDQSATPSTKAALNLGAVSSPVSRDRPRRPTGIRLSGW